MSETEPMTPADIEAAVELAKVVIEAQNYDDVRAGNYVYFCEWCRQNVTTEALASALIALADREKRLKEMAREWQAEAERVRPKRPQWDNDYPDAKADTLEECSESLLRELGVEVEEK